MNEKKSVTLKLLNSLGHRVQAARLGLDLSQTDVRNKIQLKYPDMRFNQAHVSSIENGARLPSLEAIYCLCDLDVLNVNPAYFMGMTDQDISCSSLDKSVIIDEPDINRKILIQEAVKVLQSLDDSDLACIFKMINKMKP